jgi:esterase
VKQAVKRGTRKATAAITTAIGPALPPHRTGRFKSGDVEIFYRLFGAKGKTPLAIVHGLSYFSYDWIEPAAALAAGRQVVAMDMRGFGDSGQSPDYSVPAQAGDIVSLLDYLDWQRAILVGHSMGGRGCTYAAAENPERVAGLVLVDYSPENAPAGSKRVAMTVANTPEVFASVDEAMKYFGADAHSPQGRATRARYEAYLRPVAGGYAIKRDDHYRRQFLKVIETGERPKLGVDLWESLGKVACPVLAMRGTRSDLFAKETKAKVKAANERVEMVEVKAGHNVASENLEGFLAALSPWLDRNGG